MTKLNTNDDLPLFGECPMCVQEHFSSYTWASGSAWKCSQKVVDFFHASWRIVVATAWYSLTLCESRVVPEQTSVQTAKCQVFRKIISHESDETCSHSDIQLLSLERNKRAWRNKASACGRSAEKRKLHSQHQEITSFSFWPYVT
jgi:hypothetical protein